MPTESGDLKLIGNYRKLIDHVSGDANYNPGNPNIATAGLLTALVCLLLASASSGQQKSPSKQNLGGASPQQQPRAPLPSNKGIISPTVPQSPPQQDRSFTLTPQIRQLLENLRKNPPAPRQQPAPALTPQQMKTLQEYLRRNPPLSPQLPLTPKMEKLLQRLRQSAQPPGNGKPINYPPFPKKPTLPGADFKNPKPDNPGPLSLSSPSDRSPTATAAANSSIQKQIADCVKHPSPDPRVRCVTAERLAVRNYYQSFFVSALNAGERFRVLKIKHQTVFEDGKKKNVCYFKGDAIGVVSLKDVWVDCGGLEKQGDRHTKPSLAGPGDYLKPGKPDPGKPNEITTRRDLDKRFHGALLPEKGGQSGLKIVKPKDGSTSVQVWDNFDRRKQKTATHGLVGSPRTVSLDNARVYPRYVIKGTNVAVADVVRPNKDPKKKDYSRWVFIERDKNDFVYLPKKKKKTAKH